MPYVSLEIATEISSFVTESWIEALALEIVLDSNVGVSEARIVFAYSFGLKSGAAKIE
jgi:hypothetical protein